MDIRTKGSNPLKQNHCHWCNWSSQLKRITCKKNWHLWRRWVSFCRQTVCQTGKCTQWLMASKLSELRSQNASMGGDGRVWFLSLPQLIFRSWINFPDGQQQLTERQPQYSVLSWAARARRRHAPTVSWPAILFPSSACTDCPFTNG